MSARSLYFFNSLIRIVDRKNKDFSLRPVAQDEANGSQAVEDRHINVENHQVRTQRIRFSDSILPVEGLTADLPIRFVFQDGTNPPAQHLMVVSNQNLLPRNTAARYRGFGLAVG